MNRGGAAASGGGRCALSLSLSLSLPQQLPSPSLPPPKKKDQVEGELQPRSVSGLNPVLLRDEPCLLDLFTESSFPALKRLNLSNYVGLERISIKCVAPEDVVLEYCTKMSFLDVHGSKLERLRVRSCFPRRTHHSKFTMYAPRLKVLEWEDNDVPHHCSLEDLSPLINVFVDFLSIRVEDSIAVATKTMSLVKFLRGISQAQFLSLDSHCFESPRYLCK